MFSAFGAAVLTLANVAALAATAEPGAPATAESPPEARPPKYTVFTRVESAAFVESGQIGVVTNETDSAFDLRGAGFGALAAFALRSFNDSRDIGGVLSFGVTSEYRALRVRYCGYVCIGRTDGFVGGLVYGVRIGGGYEGRVVGVHLGALAQDGSAPLETALAFPDVAMRFGPRNLLSLTFGLGAYDVPTTLRPGLYLGLSVFPVPAFGINLHWGLHCTIGSCGTTVLQADPRTDLNVQYALSPSVRAGLGAALDSTPYGNDTYEARAVLTIDL